MAVVMGVTVPVSQPVLALLDALQAVSDQAVDAGAPGLAGQVCADAQALAESVGRLAAQLARRVAALEAVDGAPVGSTTMLAQAGLPVAEARRLRRAGLFAARHGALSAQWCSGAVSTAQVATVAAAGYRLTAAQTQELVDAVVPLLPDLDVAGTRRVVAAAIDLIAPRDPDIGEDADYRQRYLSWARFRNGVNLQGYLPAAEAEAFTAAVNAMAESSRVAGDGLTAGQRRADALALLLDRALATGVPAAGGSPATVTMTMSASELARLAGRDPAAYRPMAPVPRARADGAAQVGGVPVGDATARFLACCAQVAPALVGSPGSTAALQTAPAPGSLADRLARTPVEPLVLGRAVRLASVGQRRALALRDGGCVIPGCAVAAPYTQPHHVQPWSLGGLTDLRNLASLCWMHHRHVESGRYRLTYIGPAGDIPAGDTPAGDLAPEDAPTSAMPRGSLRSGVWRITPRNPWQWRDPPG